METRSIYTKSPHRAVGRFMCECVKPLTNRSIKTSWRVAKRLLSAIALVATVAGTISELAAQNNCVNVNVYSGFTTDGGGAPYSDLIGSFQAASVSFATDTGYDWHPFDAFEFGADITGALCVTADGDYTFGLD